MNQTIKPKSAHLNHRSLSMNKKSTIGTRENLFSPTKSYISKSSSVMKPVKQKQKFDLMSASVPVQIYFNPQFKSNYAKKVIDSFFSQFDSTSQNINPENNNLVASPHKQSIRNRLLGWKKRNNVSNVQLIDTSKFIRSSPQESILSDFFEQKSLNIIAQDIQIPPKQSTKPQIIDQSLENFSSISLNQSKFLRPLSEQKKKRKNIFFDQSKSIISDSISVFFNQGSSPIQKLRRQVRKKIESNQYFQEFNVFEDENMVSKIRKYRSENSAMFIRQDKISKQGIKTLWRYSKFALTLQYPLLKSAKDLLSEQFHYGSNQLDSFIQIYPRTYYYELFLNKNQELIDIIVSMTKFIMSNKGKILTCAFQTKNLFKLNQKQYFLKDLGLSAIIQQIRIRDKNINYLYPPLFKEVGHAGKWLIRPQYLAPEVLESSRNSEYAWIQQKPEAVMAAQVWSLGCMILQILTLIPLSSDIRCRVKSNSEHIRRGYLSIKSKEQHIDIEMLQRKQKKLQTIFNRNIKTQLENVSIEKKILSVLQKMLIYEPQRRIKPQQILSEISY